MTALLTTFKGPTDRTGSRIVCKPMDPRPELPTRRTVSSNDSLNTADNHFEAVKAFCAKTGIKGRALVVGESTHGYVWVFVPPSVHMVGNFYWV